MSAARCGACDRGWIAEEGAACCCCGAAAPAAEGAQLSDPLEQLRALREALHPLHHRLFACRRRAMRAAVASPDAERRREGLQAAVGAIAALRALSPLALQEALPLWLHAAALAESPALRGALLGRAAACCRAAFGPCAPEAAAGLGLGGQLAAELGSALAGGG
eukprot:TRINITY_DN3010_c1_g4_i1.p5 TRINITY_DN3010_c1_g4~~TRINITY_DN3010_c1_g4_i1.p5  ORF type:complete len:164 (+),score=60.92 TRINITY_DN3010_c1_g4_i1:683-1174(+)